MLVQLSCAVLHSLVTCRTRSNLVSIYGILYDNPIIVQAQLSFVSQRSAELSGRAVYAGRWVSFFAFCNPCLLFAQPSYYYWVSLS